MPFYGYVPNAVKKRVIDLYEKADHDIPELMKLTRKDRILKGRTRNSIAGIVSKLKESGKITEKRSFPKRFPFANLSPEKQQELDALLRDDVTSLTDIARDFNVQIWQLRDRAASHGIPLRQKNSALKDGTNSTWPGSFERKLAELIDEGSLINMRRSRLIQILRAEFPENSDQITPDFVEVNIKEIIWTENMVSLLTRSIRDGLSPETFSEYHPNIPLRMIKDRAKIISGLIITKSPVMFIPGMGRLDLRKAKEGDDEFEFPDSSLSKPYEIAIPEDVRHPRIAVINGANLGLRHNRVIRENVIRRRLADAQRNGASVVIIANALDIDSSKATLSALFVRKAVVSGINISLSVLDPDYRPIAKELIKTKPFDRAVYQTFAEKFENVMAGWRKLTHRPPNESPEFDGPVYVILGPKDLDIIDGAVYQELRYITLAEIDRIEAEKRVVKSALAKAIGKDRKLLLKKEEQLRKLLQRTIISSVSEEDRLRRRRVVTAMVVRKFEETIPHCKVIGQGVVTVKVRDEVIDFAIPDHTRVSDRLLADFMGSVGPRILKNNIAKTTIICHPYSLNYRYAEKQRSGTKTSSAIQVAVAPIVADREFLEEKLRSVPARTHSVTKAISSAKFEPGAIDLVLMDGHVHIESKSIQSFDVKPLAGAPAVITSPYFGNEYLWIMVQTDPHWGSRSKIFIYDKQIGIHFGITEAAFQMMREAGLVGDKMPIHMSTTNDDWDHGNHYDTHKQPDPHQQSYLMIRQKMDALIAEAVQNPDPAFAVEQMRKMKEFALKQKTVLGIDYLETQMQEVISRHFDPNVDIYRSILGRALSAKLNIRGVSEFQDDIDYDSRDVAIVNIGTGNHMARTIDLNMTEGFIFANHLRAIVLQDPEWMAKKSFVDRMVKAPVYSNVYTAIGTVQVPGGYEWGLAFYSSPPRISGWGDLLLGVERNDLQRGNHTMVGENRVVLKVFGDKHMIGLVRSGGTSIYAMGPSGTSTDQYGDEYGFPPNNFGTVFIGLPVKGPDAGPELFRSLRYEHLAKYFNGNRKFDWEAFLPNPA